MKYFYLRLNYQCEMIFASTVAGNNRLLYIEWTRDEVSVNNKTEQKQTFWKKIISIIVFDFDPGIEFLFSLLLCLLFAVDIRYTNCPDPRT